MITLSVLPHFAAVAEVESLTSAVQVLLHAANLSAANLSTDALCSAVLSAPEQTTEPVGPLARRRSTGDADHRAAVLRTAACTGSYEDAPHYEDALQALEDGAHPILSAAPLPAGPPRKAQERRRSRAFLSKALQREAQRRQRAEAALEAAEAREQILLAALELQARSERAVDGNAPNTPSLRAGRMPTHRKRTARLGTGRRK